MLSLCLCGFNVLVLSTNLSMFQLGDSNLAETFRSAVCTLWLVVTITG